MKILNKVILTSLIAFSTSVLAAPTIDLYKQEQCGCCSKWAEIMQEKGYKVKTHV